MDPNISDSSKRPPSGRMRRGLRKKACLRAPSALSCFILRSLDLRFWNHTWDRAGIVSSGPGSLPLPAQAAPSGSYSLLRTKTAQRRGPGGLGRERWRGASGNQPRVKDFADPWGDS